MGINPRVSNAKASSAKLPIKSSSPAKVASLARVSSSTNKSSADKTLFISKEESFTKLSIKSGSTAKGVGSIKLSRFNGKKAKSVLPRQNALKPAAILHILLAIAPAALELILEVLKSMEFNIDLGNIDS